MRPVWLNNLSVVTDFAEQYIVFHILFKQFPIQYIAFGIVPNNKQYNNLSNKQLQPIFGTIFSDCFSTQTNLIQYFFSHCLQTKPKQYLFPSKKSQTKPKPKLEDNLETQTIPNTIYCIGYCSQYIG